MPARTRTMSAGEVAARRDEAVAYLEAARLLATSDDPADRKVSGSNAVLGGIAAADAICGHLLGIRHAGEDHAESRRLVDAACRPDRQPGAHLKRLLDEKTNFQYSASRVTATQVEALLTALERLVVRMDEVIRR
jgi:hypothetical protein